MSDDKGISLIRIIVVGGGAFSCLMVAIVGLVMMEHWHNVSGSWLDERVMFWNPIVPVALVGVFAFTRIVDKFFE